MTRFINTIVPIRLFSIERMSELDVTMVLQILLSAVLSIAVFFITQKVVSKTPGFQKEDKKLPLYYAVSCILMSSLLFFFGWSIEFFKGLIFMLTLLYASVSDIQTHEISDGASILIYVTGFIGATITELPFMLLGSLGIGGFLFLCCCKFRKRFGPADMKISAASSFLLGFGKGYIGLAIGLFLSIITNLIIEKVNKNKDHPFPLVPYLSIGYILMYFF